MANLKDLIVNGTARIIGKTYSSEFVGNVTGNLTGNAATSSKLKTARSLKITDDGTNTSTGVDFDGSDTVTLKLPSTIKASLAGNATTATTADKTAYGISVGDGVSSTAAISSWKGNEAKTLAIKGTSPITTTATTGTITITHDKKGPNTSAATSKGDTANQTPGFGGAFKVPSATVDMYGHATALADHTVTIPSSVATTSTSGLMSSADKSKLDSVASGAEVNQNAFSNVKVGSTTISADSKTDTLTLAAGNNITLTPDSASDKVTIAATDTTYTIASGDNNGQIKITPSSGSAYNVSVKGLGSRAYDSTNYLALAGGTVAGVTSFSNTTTSTSTTTGAVKISGGLGVAGDIYAAAVHNAVWNDLVDCMEVPEDTSLEFGYCYSWKSDSVIKSSRSSKNCIGIHSNTAGFVMGEKKTKTIQAAVAGFVLAYVDELYPEGTPLTWGDDGILTKCSLLKRILHPERVIATFYREEKEKKWHDLPVSGRHWVKVV